TCLAEREQFVDQLRHFLRLGSEILQAGALPLVGVFLEDSKGHLQTRQRRAELVRHIAQKSLLARDKPAKTPGQPIDGVAQPAEFVPALYSHLNVELAF